MEQYCYYSSSEITRFDQFLSQVIENMIGDRIKPFLDRLLSPVSNIRTVVHPNCGRPIRYVWCTKPKLRRKDLWESKFGDRRHPPGVI